MKSLVISSSLAVALVATLASAVSWHERLVPRSSDKTLYIKPDYCGTNNQLYWCIGVTVGEPGSSSVFSLTVDFTAGDTLLEGLPDCGEGSTRDTSSCTYGLDPFNLSSVGGTYVDGSYSTDTLVIAQTNTRLDDLSFVNFTGPNAGNPSGNLGIGPATNEYAALTKGESHSNFVQTLINKGFINEYAYSVWSDNTSTNSTGHILFGGIDPTAYTGDLVTFSTTNKELSLDGPQPEELPFLEITSISITTTKSTVIGSNIDVLASFAGGPSSTSLRSLRLPQATVKSIWDNLGLTLDSSIASQKQQVPCSVADSNPTLDLTFGDALTVNIAVSTLIVQAANVCYLDIAQGSPFGSDGEELNVLGVKAALYLYQVFDYTNNEMSLALNSFASMNQDFVEIPVGGVNAIPRAEKDRASEHSSHKKRVAIGVSVGVVVPVVLIAGGLLFFFLRRRKQTAEDDRRHALETQVPEMDGAGKSELFNSEVSSPVLTRAESVVYHELPAEVALRRSLSSKPVLKTVK